MPCKKIKRKREKDQKTVALGLDIITWISSLMKWQPQFRPTYLRIASQQGYLLHIAYSTRPDQTRPDQTSANKKNKEIKKNNKKIKKK
jgi:hypothetical protein